MFLVHGKLFSQREGKKQALGFFEAFVVIRLNMSLERGLEALCWD